MKSALVTGGGQGIGKSIAGVLLKHGYKVAILDVNVETGKETTQEFTSQFGSGSCVFFKCDVTDSQQLKDLYEEVTNNLGSPAVVVNNAGILDEQNWSKTIDVNLRAVIDLTYLAVSKMRKDTGGNGGTIVNVASIVGTEAIACFSAYCATKWGVVGFTQSMVTTLSHAEVDTGISLLTLCPSFVATPLVKTIPSREHLPVPECVPGEGGQKALWSRVELGVLSIEELETAFEKLFTENKNGAVMVLEKTGDQVKCEYLKKCEYVKI